MKKIITLTLLVFVANSSAGVLDKLKSQPASKYELGKFQLELMAYILTEESKGEKFGESGFRLNKFYVEELENKLFLVANLEGRAKDMNNDACDNFNQAFNQTKPFDEIEKNIWPGLSDADYKAIKSEFLLSTELVSKENQSFKIRCQ
jgi:hypothetical protein